MSDLTKNSTNRRSAVLWGVLVVVVVFWTAHEVTGFDFVAWDDELNILVNPHLGPPTAHNVTWMFTDSSYMRRYVPFGWLGFSVAYAFSGLSPVAYHWGNLLLHVANAWLLYVLIAWALRRWLPQVGENRIFPSAASGALFWAIHPLRAETIGWSSGMLYSLACFFALLSVIAYFRAQNCDQRGYSAAWRWTAATLYAISLLTYPITLGLIAVFLAIDAAELRRCRDQLGTTQGVTRLKNLCLQKIPFLIAAVAVMAVTVIARVMAGSFWGKAPGLTELPMIDRLMRALYTVVYYLWKSCWPTNLTPLPTQLSEFTPFCLPAVLSGLAVGGLTWLFWRIRKRRPGALLLWLCYLMLLIPMLGFTEKAYHTSDRYAYLPAMMGSLAVAAALATISRTVSRAAVTASVVASVVVLVALAKMNSVQLRVWQDSPTLFARCIERSTNVRLTNDMYQRWANFHSFRGNVPAATAVLVRAERDGLHGPVRDEIAANLAQAREEIRQGSPPLVARIHGDIAVKLAKEGRAREADEHFTAALNVAPQFASLRYNQALHAAACDDPRRALALFLTAAAQADGTISVPAQRQAWSLIAQAFTRINEPELAKHAEKRARLLTDS